MTSSQSTSAASHQQPQHWGDQGDGTYTNPILPSDFSDPDIIRAGDDFYLICSDFHFMGMQVLHSRDLVNWQIVNQIFHRLDIDDKYSNMSGYGQGTWAPAFGYHNGEFYVYVCTPFDGLYMWHTKNPAGQWSPTITVKTVERWEDPCPFWDDDGQAYLIHSLKGAGPLIIHKMSEDGTKLLDDGVEIYRGPTAEGPKLFKRNGFYYISLPEGGVHIGWQAMLRSRNIYGPYEHRIVLPAGSPHQGGMVNLASGQSWFLGFKSAAFLGRVSYLEPVRWGEDNWPIFGDAGNPVARWKKPDVGQSQPIAQPQTSDEFDSPTLSPVWQWNHNPIDSAWSLTQRPGFLRLTAQPAENLPTARNTLTQKLWDQTGIIDVKLDVSHLQDGARAGLTFMSGDRFQWVGVIQNSGRRNLESQQGIGPDVSVNTIWLRGQYSGSTAHLFFSLDGQSFTEIGGPVELQFANWKGARVGLYCFGPGGSGDFDYFHYRYGVDAEGPKTNGK